MTAEYLDRSSLVARMKYYEKHTTEESGEHYAYSVALREIRNAPAADVAEVVRCKDCKHKVRTDANGIVICSEEHGMYCPTENDFCSYGGRRGGDNDNVSD